MSQTEEKLAAHVGVASSLAPPKEEKRQRRSGGSQGLGSARRVGCGRRGAGEATEAG